MGERSERLRRVLFEGFSLVSLIILFIIVVFTSLNTNSSLIYVLLGFMPTMVTIILCLLMFDESTFSFVILWATPFILSGLFFFVATSQSLLRSNMDIGSLVTINIILSLLYLIVFFALAKFLSPKEHTKHKPSHSSSHPMAAHQPNTIREYIASIEDKSKALNFVIGRVYSKFHGGTKQMREKLSLKSEWYNEFSDALQNGNEPDKKRLLSVLDNIERQLAVLSGPEKNTLLPEEMLELRNLERNASGDDKIIDILVKNDKDPVESYFAGAKEFCLKLRDILQQ